MPFRTVGTTTELPFRVGGAMVVYVAVGPGGLVKVLGTKYRVVRKTMANGRTYHALEEHTGRGSAYSVRYEKQIITIEGLYYRAGLDMFGTMALIGLNDDELRRLGLPTPPPLTEAEQAASREEAEVWMDALKEVQLSEISRLREIGAITDAEYEAKRNEILDSL